MFEKRPSFATENQKGQPILNIQAFSKWLKKQCPIAGQAIIAGQTRAGCWYRVFLSLYTSHHDTSYAFKPVKGFKWGFKENRDGKGAQQQELNNINPSKSFLTVSGMRCGHSNQAHEMCPFWPLLWGPLNIQQSLPGPTFKWPSSKLPTLARLTPLGLWSDSCKGFKENRDGWSAEQEDLNNVTPSKSF